MACGWSEPIRVVHLHCVLQLTILECVDVHCSVLVPTLMTGPVSHDVSLNMLVKLVPFARLGFLHHLMNGVGNFADSAQLMLQNVSHHDHCW